MDNFLTSRLLFAFPSPFIAFYPFSYFYKVALFRLLLIILLKMLKKLVQGNSMIKRNL